MKMLLTASIFEDLVGVTGPINKVSITFTAPKVALVPYAGSVALVAKH